MGQLMDLVFYYDQDVLGVDLPVPKEIFIKPVLWSDDGRQAFGLADARRQRIAVQSGRSVIDSSETLMHECLHLLPGWGVNMHPQIYMLQQRFGNLLRQLGY